MHHKNVFVLSGWTVERLLSSPRGEVDASLDLGVSRSVVKVEEKAVLMPDGKRVAFEDLKKELPGPEDCAAVQKGEPWKIYLFSEGAGKYYKLFQPKIDMAPTLVVNNATMHSIKGGGPREDAERKIASLPRVSGPCLDTCCGPGYSAQLLSNRSEGRVTTCEADPNVLKVASFNPWSRGLFDSANIDIIRCDVRDYLELCREGAFKVIFHDPPTIFQAGELYSEQLYRSFFHVLAQGGVLYHYIGAPGRKQGKDYMKGVVRRLEKVGFRTIRRSYGGVTARL